MSVMGFGGGQGGVIDTAYVEILAKGDRFVQSWQREFDRGSRGVQLSARRAGTAISTEVDRGSRRAETSVKRLADSSDRHFRRTGGAVKGMFAAVGAGLAAAGIGRKLNEAIQGASGMNELGNQVNVTFGKMSPTLKRFGDTAATSVGQSRRAALDAVVQFGDLFRTTGSNAAEAEKMGIKFTTLAGNLASFKNVRPEEAMEALRSGLIGEAEPMRRFGVLLSETRVQQEAFRQTGKKSAKDLTEQEKVQARYNLILRDSSRASGDFKETATELANAQRTSAALWTNLSDSIGAIFLPVAKEVFQVLNTQVLPSLQRFVDREGPQMKKTLTDFVKGLDFSKAGEQLSITWEAITEGARGFGSALRGEGVTSDGFVGIMEKLGVVVLQVKDALKQGASASGESATQMGLLSSVGKGVGDTLSVAQVVIGFLADHVDDLARHLPLLVGAFIAYKTAQAASNAATAAQTALLPIQIAAQIAHAIALRSVAKAQTQLAVATAGGSTATVINTGVTNISTLSVLKSVAAWLAQKAALVASRAATLAMAVAQRVLNLVLAANPIGLVITAIILLVGLIVRWYQTSERGRRIIQAGWRGIKESIAAAIDFIIKALRFWLDTQFKVVEGILRVMGKLPGPMGAPFRKAEEAVKKARTTVNTQLDAVQRRVNQLRGKDIPVKAKANVEIQESTRRGLLALGIKGYGTKFFHGGGRLSGYGGGDIQPAMLEPGEAVVPKEKVRRPEFRAWAAAMGIPGFQGGGLVALDQLPRFQTAAYDATSTLGERAAEKIAQAAARGIAGQIKEAVEGGGMLGGLGGGPGWQWQMRVLRAAFPGLALISGFRPGARTHATGALSWHARGRAVDVPPRMDVFNWIRGHYGARTLELIFSPAGNRQLYRGRPHYYSGVTRADHWNHVHWAMRHGGLVRTLADAGFTLMPGLNAVLAENKTGAPEPLVPARQGAVINVAAGAVQVTFHGVDQSVVPLVRAELDEAFTTLLRNIKAGV